MWGRVTQGREGPRDPALKCERDPSRGSLGVPPRDTGAAAMRHSTGRRIGYTMLLAAPRSPKRAICSPPGLQGPQAGEPAARAGPCLGESGPSTAGSPSRDADQQPGSHGVPLPAGEGTEQGQTDRKQLGQVSLSPDQLQTQTLPAPCSPRTQKLSRLASDPLPLPPDARHGPQRCHGPQGPVKGPRDQGCQPPRSVLL